MSRSKDAKTTNGKPAFTIAGSPVMIASQMSDVAPGTTPIAFGN